MKVAIVSANFGRYDLIHPVMAQSIECDHFYFTEKNSPLPLRSLNDRMKAKYFKVKTHKILTGAYDYVIWHDASIKIESKDFARYMVDKLTSSRHIAIPIHPKRPNLEEELLFIMDGMDHQDTYLCSRYDRNAIKHEYQFLCKEGAQNLTLFACGLFAFKNDGSLNKYFDAWWETIERFSEFDQCGFSYCFKEVVKARFDFNEPFTMKMISRTEHNERN